MKPTIYVEGWAAYSFLVEALLRVKPMEGLEVRPYSELDDPVAQESRETSLTSLFVGYRDEGDATYSFLSVAEALDRKFTDTLLCGETPLTRALVRSVCQIIDEGHLMLAASNVGDLPGYDGPMWHDGSRAPEAMQETYYKKMVLVERYARDEAFLLGASPTLPDVIVAACIWYAEAIGITPLPDNTPRLDAWYRRHCEDGVFRAPSD